MPTNKLIYLGVLVVAATALLWLGAELAKRVEWILPYAGIVGVLMIVAGLAMEMKKKRATPEAPAIAEAQGLNFELKEGEKTTES